MKTWELYFYKYQALTAFNSEFSEWIPFQIAQYRFIKILDENSIFHLETNKIQLDNIMVNWSLQQLKLIIIASDLFTSVHLLFKF